MSSTLKWSNGDIDISAVTGQPTVITGVEKCAQDVAEVMMLDRKQTNASSAAFPRAYGNKLASIETPVFFSGLIGKPLVSRKIQEAIQTLIDAQNNDPNITPDEHIINISRLLVESLNVTDYIYFVEVTVESGSPVPGVSNLEATKLDHQFALTSGIVDAPNGGKFVP